MLGFNYPFTFSGLEITTSKFITDPYLSDRVQYKFPRSKKKRIRKKWAKNPKNWKNVPKLETYQIGDTLIMHPEMLSE